MSETVIQAGEVVERVGKTDRTLFAGIMLGVLIFVAYLVWSYSSSQSRITDSFLSAMEKRDDKTSSALQQVTDALNRNTEIMVELKTRIK